MHKLLFLILATSQLTFAGEAQINLDSMTYEEANILLEKAYLNPNHSDYTRKTISFNRKHNISEKGDCYSFDGEVLLITITDIDGVIQRAISRTENKKSECYVKIFEGQKFPAPPYAPFFDQWIFI